MDPGSLLLKLGAVVLLVLANAFFVAAEFALVASRRTRIEAMIRRGDRKAKTVRKALDDLNRQLSAAQLGITVASILLGYVAEQALGELFHSWLSHLPAALSFATRAGFAATVAVATVSVLHVVIGEQAPKTWAIAYPERTSRWVAGPLFVFSWITRPVTGALNWSATRVVRLMGIRSAAGNELDRVHSPEEIRMLVEQSQRAGQIEKGNARLLAGVFEFSEKNAREVMTPRTQIVALHETDSLTEAADQIAAAGRSRYPVYRESLDDIVGIVHAKDVLAALRRPGPPVTLASLVRPVHFVPGSREVEDVLADMKKRKEHMVIVLDEFGGTAGLVTMEDLLEEIVGQIEDEYDRPARASGSPAAQGVAVLSGSTELTEISERYGLPLESDDYTTLGGYLFGALGRLPRVGDRVEVKGGTFEVTAMDGRRVAEARFTKTASQKVGESESQRV